MIRILIVRDDKPGHYNQSEAIAMAIARKRPVSIERVTAARSWFIPQRTLRWIVKSRWVPARVLARFVVPPDPIVDIPDLVVSAGGDTLVANVVLSRMFDCRNIFCGSVRGIPLSMISVIFAGHGRSSLPGVHYGLKPAPIDPDMITDNDCDAVAMERGLPGVETGCLLVGGPTRTHRFTARDWRCVIEMVSHSDADALAWIILDSRRTPQAWRRELADLARDRANVSYIPYSQASQGRSIPSILAADFVVVTEDSNSMITEAVCGRKPVITIRPDDRRLDPEDTNYLDWLGEQGLTVSLRASTLSLDAVKAGRSSIQTLTANHLDRLFEAIETAIPSLSAGRHSNS